MANAEKAKYRRLIEGSPLFDLDREKDYSAYRRELNNMREYLYHYVTTGNEKKYEVYGSYIIETADDCIRGYNRENGVPFLNYFLASWGKARKRLEGEEHANKKYGAMHFSRETLRAIRNYRRYAEKCLPGLTEGERNRRIALAMDITYKEAVELCWLSKAEAVSGDSPIRIDEESPSLWENLAAPEYGNAVEESEGAEETLAVIERLYRRVQERQKQILSDLVTIHILEDYSLIREQAEVFSFVNREIWENFIAGEPLPTQRDIARKYDRDESSVSRTWNSFLEKLREELVKE